MNMPLNITVALGAALAGVGAALCPLCGDGVQAAKAQGVSVAVPAPDTATVRFHVSGMTCGS
ncbi:MAG: hypothetical protein HY560_07110, partial [Gemmatimonadetes bacterium]|nr:hypothetical protein [Gemmatimonadota bacterium]